MESMGQFLEQRLRLKLNRNKSVVDRPWKRTFLGRSMTPNKEPKLKVARGALQRAKGDLSAGNGRGPWWCERRRPLPYGVAAPPTRF